MLSAHLDNFFVARICLDYSDQMFISDEMVFQMVLAAPQRKLIVFFNKIDKRIRVYNYS